jgi:hypothetical protein
MKMKNMRASILCLFTLLLTAPMLQAQDLSKYRTFSLGNSLASVLKHTEQRLSDVKMTHGRPSLVQELTWWPKPIGTSFRSDAVEQVLFSFCNGELYKISVTYDRASTEGLTASDMMKAITAQYGPATNVALEIDVAPNDRYDPDGKGVASWEDSQYSVNLVRSSFTDVFGLVIYSKRLNTEAELAIAEAVKVETQEGPKREAERKQKATDDLEVARQKNRRVFQP